MKGLVIQVSVIKRVATLSVLFLVLTTSIVYVLNASWLAPKPDGEYTVISHRGVYQTYDRKNLGNFDCTANRIYPPSHNYIENTLPSIEQALKLGADVVEIDIKYTLDKQFVVFHDHTLDCRTDGTGSAKEKTLAELKALDIGYGYTADNGKTFPFRGKGVGLMPALEEVLRGFPDTQFLINIKDGRAKAANELVDYLESKDLLESMSLLVYGDTKPTERLVELVPNAQMGNKKIAKACIKQYVKWGWSGIIPEVCKNTFIYVPVDKTHLIWGWPNRFLHRMASVNTQVVLLGPIRDGRIHGFYEMHELDRIPEGFNGGIWVEQIETLGPALKARKASNKRS
jgi:glycerophosphoryl diester phosphodiesterase